MNFFEHQDRARSTTRKLVLLFSLGIASLILVTSFFVVFVVSFSQSSGEPLAFDQALLNSEIFLVVGVVVIAVVLLGTMFRMRQLRGGGRVVAEALGGRLLNLHTRDADERKILNVVEEMAIACGLPVPPVYLLEDSAINAFAAGFQKEDAVIGITRGCIQLLDRYQLQGVIAHEFSHIFNGDMRLNIRLIGWLYGIMVIGMIGYFILRSNAHHLGGRGKNNKGGIVLLALGLVIIGYGGTFFGNLIKAAVSRQREFLADASAVQFTRYPDGIAGALKKIAASAQGTLLTSTDASEVSHMLFGQGIKAGFTGLFATHPPLEERIRRIQPNWDGSVDDSSRNNSSRNVRPGKDSQAQASGHAGISSGFAAQTIAEHMVTSIGEPSAAHLLLAAGQLAALPPALLDEVHSSLGASLLMRCLIVAGSSATVSDAQRALLLAELNPESFSTCLRLLEQIQTLPRELHMVLLELALPSLKQLSAAQISAFLSHLMSLIKADQDVSLFEWCVFRILQQHLAPGAKAATGRVDLARCVEACEIVLSTLAHVGQDSGAAMEAAFAAAAAALDLRATIKFRPQTSGVEALEQAMTQLQSVKPLQKPRVLKAMVASIARDGKLLPAEVELLRAAGALLDCPVPPITLGSLGSTDSASA